MNSPYYIYNDEDNAPMNNDVLPEDPVLKYTTYSSKAEMKAYEAGLPFNDPGHDNGCWNCINYDGDRCHAQWNNNDDDYYLPDRDDREPDDCCEDWSLESTAVWEDYFNGTDT